VPGRSTPAAVREDWSIFCGNGPETGNTGLSTGFSLVRMISFPTNTPKKESSSAAYATR